MAAVCGVLPASWGCAVTDLFSHLVTEEEEEEEEFLDTLPMDMMEDGDLQQMTVMAHQASFLTRDLSSW